MKQQTRRTPPLYTLWLTCSVCALSLIGAAHAEMKSPYGPDDTLGAINNLSPEKVIQAARLVTEGKTYALGIETGVDTPAYGPRQYQMTIVPLSDGSGTTMGSNQATANDDLMVLWMGIGSQIDGLGHMGVNHVYYNNTHARDFVSTSGLTKFGIHTLPPIVTRGIMLDMTKQLGKDPLPEGTVINRAEIQAAAKAQNLQINKGDVVLLHTGWLNIADSDPDRFMAGEPGLGLDGAQYLASLGIVAVGSDTWALEALPGENPEELFPVHPELLAKNGVYILENMDTRGLAADDVHEFLFVLGQPRFVGAVQAVINPVAIR